jgi:hypothetical protein
MPLSLPGLDTDAGVMARLFIAESMQPGIPHNSNYVEAECFRGMQLMRVVIDNRLIHRPGGASGYLATCFGDANASTPIDIVVASGQFAGFSRTGGNVILSASISNTINGALQWANQGAPSWYYRFVTNAISVAQAAVPSDEFSAITQVGGISALGRTFGWRSSNQGSPGPNFLVIPGGSISGNQFFGLRSIAI